MDVEALRRKMERFSIESSAVSSILNFLFWYGGTRRDETGG